MPDSSLRVSVAQCANVTAEKYADAVDGSISAAELDRGIVSALATLGRSPDTTGILMAVIILNRARWIAGTASPDECTCTPTDVDMVDASECEIHGDHREAARELR